MADNSEAAFAATMDSMMEPVDRYSRLQMGGLFPDELSNVQREGQEFALKPGVSLAALLVGALSGTWDALLACFRGKLVWVNQSVAFIVHDSPYLRTRPNRMRRWSFSADKSVEGIEELWVHCYGPSEDQVQQTFQSLFTHMTNATRRTEPTTLKFEAGTATVLVGAVDETQTVPPLPLTVPLLIEYLETNSGLTTVTFHKLLWNIDMCDILSSVSRLRPSLKLKVSSCNLDPTAHDACSSLLQDNLGPTHIEFKGRYDLDLYTLRVGPQGNNRLESLGFASASYRASCDRLDEFARDLSFFQGLKTLTLDYQPMSTPHLLLLCPSIGQHPTLVHLHLEDHFRSMLEFPDLLEAEETQRLQAIADMVQQNPRLLSAFCFFGAGIDHAIYHEQIVPALQVNLRRTRVRAIAATEHALRPRLLGRALFQTRHDPNGVWMFLEGIIDAWVETLEP